MNLLNNNKKEIIILLIVPLLFLYKMVFLGEVVTTNDELERHPINEWRDTYLDNNSDIPQWYPNLFSGMPSYGGYIYTNGDPTKFIRSNILFNPGLKVWFYLVLSGLGMFFLLQFFKVSKSSALLGSCVSALTPYVFGLINAGHLNKIFAMAYTPWVLLTALSLIDRVTIKRLLSLSLVTALQLWTNHPQVAYYTWMCIGFYYVWFLSSCISRNIFSIKKSINPLFGLIIAIVISLFMVSDPYIDIYKFQEHSNRGSTSVLDQSGQTKSGTKWEYATQWSFHPKEIVSFIYPYYYGLQNSSDLDKGAYWGFMPFTQSTHYVGLVILFFAILGALLKRPEESELILWIITILIIMTGFGSYFSILYKPFFSFLPFFSKFRIPSMIYMLLAITIPILGAKGIDTFCEMMNEKSTVKKTNYLLTIILGVSLILFLFSKDFISFSGASDGRYNPATLAKLISARIDLFNKGLVLVITILIAVFIMIYSVLNKKIKKTTFIYGLLIISLLDLVIVNLEFMNVKPASNLDRAFAKNPVIEFLEKNLGSSRIFPADRLGSNRYSYWNFGSIGGYRPIKLRNYQDLMDARGFSRPKVLDMLNVKYILTNKKIKNPNFIPVKNLKGIYENKNVLPKAWIVKNIKSVKTQKESLMEVLLSGFDPKTTAIILNYKGSEIPQESNGIVEINYLTENKIELSSKSDTGGLLVLSEIFYQPGWKATINGKDTPIYQTNHILRSIEIPEGDSEIIFRYDTSNWKNARFISRSSFFLVLFGLFGLVWKEKNTIIKLKK